jgi:hypothetical protein
LALLLSSGKTLQPSQLGPLEAESPSEMFFLFILNFKLTDKGKHPRTGINLIMA